MSTLRPTPRQAAWRNSERLKEIGREALGRWNAEQRQAAVCGAKGKRTGEPCQAPGLENGRCRLHGGLTPKGDRWHQPRWSLKDSARGEEKLARKLKAFEKRWKEKQERVAAMTPEERARFDLWQRRHKPGSAAARARACAEIRRARELRDDVERHEAAEAREAVRAAQCEPEGSTAWFERIRARVLAKDADTAGGAQGRKGGKDGT